MGPGGIGVVGVVRSHDGDRLGSVIASGLDREAFYQRLHRNGSRAYHEFKRAEEIWRAREGD